jgi:hypothetical protein
MTPVHTHKVFGTVNPVSRYITAGGNDVVESRCTDGQTRILLTAERYWKGTMTAANYVMSPEIKALLSDAPDPSKSAYVLYAHHVDGACSELDRTAEFTLATLEEANWGSVWQFNAASDEEVQGIVLDWRRRMIEVGGMFGGEYGTLMVQRKPAHADENSDDVNKIFPDEGWGDPIICPMPVEVTSGV